MPGTFLRGACAPFNRVASAQRSLVAVPPRAGIASAETLLVLALVGIIIAAALAFDPNAFNAADDFDALSPSGPNLNSDVVLELAPESDGRYAFTLNGKGQISKRDVGGLREPDRIPFRQGRPTAMAFATTRQLLVVGTANGQLVPLDSVSRKPRPRHASWQLEGRIGGCAVSADGRRMAAISDHGMVGLWDLDTGKNILQCTLSRPQHLEGQQVRAHGAALSANGERLLVAWGPVTYCFHADGRELLVAGPYDVIVRAVALSGDGTRAALGTVAGDIFCWDVDTETLVWSFRETLPVRRTCFSPDASLLAFACDGNVVHILDAESGIPHQQWVGGPRYVKSLVWDESGVLFCAGATQGVCRWDVGDPSSPKRTRRVLASGARGH